jgi:hypothetical protein
MEVYSLTVVVGEYRDAGQAFYATDFWSLWDLGTVAVGLAFFITSRFSRHNFCEARQIGSILERGCKYTTLAVVIYGFRNSRNLLINPNRRLCLMTCILILFSQESLV